MDVGEEVVQPFADIDLRQFAASHKGIDDGSVLGCIVVATEKIVLAPLCSGANYVGIIGFLNCRIDIFLRPTQHNFRGFSYIATVSLMKPCSICLIKFI